ncbi:MAG: phosphotransferase [Planctomycetaceae bacterium]|nr:phosphotransferase [Planctomycetaceae bacterium]
MSLAVRRTEAWRNRVAFVGRFGVHARRAAKPSNLGRFHRSVHERQVSGILDWEFAGVGWGEYDLAWVLGRERRS